MRWRNFVLVALLAMLCGCDQEALMKSQTPPEDEATARRYIDLLRQGQFDLIEREADPAIKSAALRETLTKMQAAIPAGEPISVKVVGAHIVVTPGVRQSNITFEFEYPGAWMLANVAIQKKGEAATIIGLNVYRIRDSLEAVNRFAFAGKTILHYAMLAVSIAVPVFIAAMLWRCLRTRNLRRKWLWLLFIAVGFGAFAFDWTSGAWRFQVLAVQLFGAGFTRQPYGPWVISVSLPIGAVAYLVWQRLRRPSPETA